jgi:hypothetical protein
MTSGLGPMIPGKNIQFQGEEFGGNQDLKKKLFLKHRQPTIRPASCARRTTDTPETAQDDLWGRIVPVDRIMNEKRPANVFKAYDFSADSRDPEQDLTVRTARALLGL